MEEPMVAPDRKNLYCAGCGQQEVHHLCPCKQSGLYLCDACVTSHVAKYRAKSHNILPIQTINYYKLPGYVEAFRERTNETHDKALEELRSSVQQLDEWKAQFLSEASRLSTLLSAKCAKVSRDFDQIKRYLESETLAGIQEMQQKVFEPNPALTSSVAKALWRYKPGSLKLLSCESQFSGLFTPVDDYIERMKVLLKVEFPGEELLRETAGDSDVIVVPRKHDLRDGYIGQRDGSLRKDGWGREVLPGGDSFEGLWTAGRKTRGKQVCAGKAAIGDWQEQRTQGRKTLWAALLLVAAIAVGSAGLAGPVDPPVVLTLFEEGPRNTSIGQYWGEWLNNTEREGFGKQIYLTGEVYEGYWQSDMLNGKGRLVTSKGDVYEGEWVDGEFHGLGTVNYRNGNLAVGRFCRGALCGVGMTHTHVTNRTYFGEFEKGMPSGKGVVFYGHTPLFSGIWKSGIKTGHGVEHGRDRVCFGEYQSNQLHGEGTCLFTTTGAVYQGSWDGGRKNGNGTQYYPAEVFHGAWRSNSPTDGEYRYNDTYKTLYELSQAKPRSTTWNSILADASWLLSVGPLQREFGIYHGQVNAKYQRHGYGVQNYSDGSSYEGYWSRDLRHGKGKLHDKLGRVYEGDWSSNTFTGCGILKWSDTVKQGTWVNKKMEGLGMERYQSSMTIGLYEGNALSGPGAKFDDFGGLTVGYWQADKLNGTGIELYRNGDLYMGEFREGSRAGNGTYLWKNGDYYIGEFSGNSRNGHGKMSQGNEVFTGKWINGVKHGEGTCRLCSAGEEKCQFDPKH